MLQISVIFGVKDRNDRIKPMLESWIDCPYIKEFIIIDWNSNEEIYNLKLIRDNINRPIKVIRVNNEDYYHRTKAYNLAKKYSSFPILMKLDVDYVSTNWKWMDKVAKNTIEDKLNNFFICGDFRFSKSLTGFLLVNKNDFANAGEFREDLEDRYGYEDEDLVERLSKNTQKVIFFNIEDYIYHIPHQDNLRVANCKDKIKNPLINKTMCKLIPNFSNYSKYNIISTDINYIELERVKSE